MKIYIVAYDLHSPGQNYAKIHKHLESYGSWCRLQGSVWLIRVNKSAATIRDEVNRYTDANDVIFVAEVGPEWATMRHTEECNNWLSQCL